MLQSLAKLRRELGAGSAPGWRVRCVPTRQPDVSTMAVGRAGFRVLLARCNALFTEATDVSSKSAVSVAE
jgi:hypothetical protein